MKNPTAEELEEARGPVASLISKSEKARQKLAPDSWQHRMSGDNLKALYIGAALMNKGTSDHPRFTRDSLEGALSAFGSMISKTEKVHSRFAPGSSQYALLRNRLRALRVVEGLTMKELRVETNGRGFI